MKKIRTAVPRAGKGEPAPPILPEASTANGESAAANATAAQKKGFVVVLFSNQYIVYAQEL
jgi:hypothetical protein